MTRVAGIQMASGPNVSANLMEVDRLIALAVADGAELVVLPENFALVEWDCKGQLAIRESEGEGPIQDFLSAQASKHGIWLVGGTLPLRTQNSEKVNAAVLVFDDRGVCVARYNKMHLFDVHVAESNEDFHESSVFVAGQSPVVLETPFGKMGLAVCYDLRFPELFRHMLQQGVELIALPAAFTAVTGKAHWEVLVRARAIENLCYVVASAQGGYHACGRETHGNTMIVDPWGTLIDHLAKGSGVVCGDIDRDRVTQIRDSFPVTQHQNPALQ
ncbi:MAG TPA: carbon-nitrogen hydrolase family protein [Myxococcales bacterium]|nr:carbon-nitrogen hydrolase family protein [Myxococcales bacterium]